MLCPEELVTLITAAAITLAYGKSQNELAILSAIFVMLGDTLATISTQKAILAEMCENSKKEEDTTTLTQAGK